MKVKFDCGGGDVEEVSVPLYDWVRALSSKVGDSRRKIKKFNKLDLEEQLEFVDWNGEIFNPLLEIAEEFIKPKEIAILYTSDASRTFFAFSNKKMRLWARANGDALMLSLVAIPQDGMYAVESKNVKLMKDTDKSGKTTYKTSKPIFKTFNGLLTLTHGAAFEGYYNLNDPARYTRIPQVLTPLLYLSPDLSAERDTLRNLGGKFIKYLG